MPACAEAGWNLCLVQWPLFQWEVIGSGLSWRWPCNALVAVSKGKMKWVDVLVEAKSKTRFGNYVIDSGLWDG